MMGGADGNRRKALEPLDAQNPSLGTKPKLGFWVAMNEAMTRADLAGF